jgi:hypothetical protein
VAINAAVDDGDLRVGLLPWALAFAMVCLAACCLGLLAVHGPSPARVLIVGAWWTALAILGVAGFFLAVAIGELIGVDEEDVGLAALPPLLGIMFGAVSMAPALAILAAGIGRARILPVWSRGAASVAAPILPLLLLLGVTEAAVETIGSAALIAIFGSSWIRMGIGITWHD